jgi:uncharacterized protein (DUF305 family)
MNATFRHTTSAALLALSVLAACSTVTRGSGSQTGASSLEASAASDSAEAAGGREYTDADVRFLRGMIAHHAQALLMTDMVPSRTRTVAMRLLAERIEVSQRDEIAAMQRWLEQRGEPAPASGVHQHGDGAHGMMPGMLTDAELAALAAATGPEFDRLFLELMIKHHEGALVMVKDLFASPGAGQEPELFVLASDIEADQRGEIRRMQAMLAASPGASRDR